MKFSLLCTLSLLAALSSSVDGRSKCRQRRDSNCVAAGGSAIAGHMQKKSEIPSPSSASNDTSSSQTIPTSVPTSIPTSTDSSNNNNNNNSPSSSSSSSNSNTMTSTITFGSGSRTFSFYNKCGYDIWVGTYGQNSDTPANGGFKLPEGTQADLNMPNQAWSGRFWARTGCQADGSHCQTGDCGGLQCNGNAGAMGPTLAEFTLNAYMGADFYDVSMVDGYNVDIQIRPKEGTFSRNTYPASNYSCGVAGACNTNPLSKCDPQYAIYSPVTHEIIQCLSACTWHMLNRPDQAPQYCCTDGTPYFSRDTCLASSNANMMKSMCPDSYSWAYDDASSTFACGGSGTAGPGGISYEISFCGGF